MELTAQEQQLPSSHGQRGFKVPALHLKPKPVGVVNEETPKLQRFTLKRVWQKVSGEIGATEPCGVCAGAQDGAEPLA